MVSRQSGQAEQVHAALEQCEADLAAAHEGMTNLRAAIVESELRNSDLEAELVGTDEAATAEAAVEACQSRLVQTQGALADCRSQLGTSSGVADQLERAEEHLRACQNALRRSFVLVVVSWSTSHDVDLHVIDPAGREFYYERRRISGTAAALEEDNTRGPGNEVWLHPSAETGRYRVCYKLFRGSSPTDVRGSILWQEGKIEIPDVRLTRRGQVRIAVEVVVDDDGRVSVDRSRSGQQLNAGGCS